MSLLPAARLTVDLDALAANHAVLRVRAGGVEMAPVVKADGYGLGSGPVGRRLWAEGARKFFVAHLSEGEALRAALGPDRPATIFVLDGFTAGSGPRLAAADLTPVLSALPQIEAASAFAAASGRLLPVGLHFDTGMNRQGMAFEEAKALAQVSDRLSRLDVVLVMSHLGSAAAPEHPRNREQLERFRTLRALFPDGQASLAASAGIWLGPDYAFDLARPGVSLYGSGPLETPHADFRAVATLEAPILDIRHLPAGAMVGYGSGVILKEPTRVAMVAAGYADGVFRSARAGGYAWAAGARRPLVVVNMNLLAVDLGDAKAQVGDPVELLGPNALLDDQAAAGGTVAHEVLVRLSRRVERIYLGEA